MYMQTESSQSLSLIHELLRMSFHRDTESISIQARQCNCEADLDFDSKGSTRVEILYDTLLTEKNSERIMVYGIAENTDEQQVPFTLFCETRWNDTEYPQNRLSSLDKKQIKSLIMDFKENSHTLSGADFGIVFKDEGNGQEIGEGFGYLRFERGDQLVQ